MVRPRSAPDGLELAPFTRAHAGIFLRDDLYGQAPPFEIFCSHQLTKRLFPNLPSQNIRGTG